jgi:UDP-3-O-[3-hydroxymyristoyl] glucosamine N-acyltransferase
MAEITVAELALRVGGEVVGDGDRVIRGVATLESAQADQLSLVAHRKYISYVAATRAAAVLVGRDLASELDEAQTRIVVNDPHVALREVLVLFHPPTRATPGVHPTAIIEDEVELGAEVSIGPYAVIGRGTRIGARVEVGSHTVIGAGCLVGNDCALHSHVTLYPGVRMGSRCTVQSGARLGCDGFGYVFVEGEHRSVPQVGGCVLGDDVDVGANTTIDRGSIGDTVIGHGAKLDNLIQIGHNVRIGERAILIAQVGVAGSAIVGNGAVLGGQVGVAGHLSIGAGARVGAQGGVIGDIPAGQTVSGYPARPHREALRAQAAFFKLPETVRKLRELERKLARE